MLSLRDTMIESTLAGGHVLREHFGHVTGVRQKEDHSSVVTAADFASEAAIVAVIERAYPDHNLIAEERGFVDRGAGFTWVIDPLDGTSNFAAGLPWFGVLVALLEGAVPVLGAMYLPCDDTLYVGEAGQGVTRNGTPVRVTAETDPRNVLCAYGMDASADITKTRREAETLTRLVNGVRNVRTTNSLLDFCYTVDGRLGAVVNQNTKIWDIAPAWLLLREAGGVLTDTSGAPLHFALAADTYARSYAVIGASLALHPCILEIINL
ncbi:MAG: inositol monophosphatase [Anaerolineae bacterium]